MALVSSSTLLAEKVTWYYAMFMALMLVMSCCEGSENELDKVTTIEIVRKVEVVNNRAPCDKIYVVKEGETLHTISEKCGDPFIAEENPHIHDPDDIFPGLAIKITPFNNR